MTPVNNFTVLESVYGKFIVNRHCAYQADALVKTGRPHIDEELQKILSIAHTLPKGSVFVDAGANIGLVAVPAAQLLAGKGGLVLAFEVQRMLYYALAGSAALNDLTNLFVMNNGLGAEIRDEMIPLPDYGAPQDFGTFSLLGANPQPKCESLRVLTLDSMELPGLDFLKIDVEGMEIDVIQGARQSIARYRPWCWVEHWIVGTEAVKAAFPCPDYEFYLVDGMNMLCAPSERLKASGLTLALPPV